MHRTQPRPHRPLPPFLLIALLLSLPGSVFAAQVQRHVAPGTEIQFDLVADTVALRTHGNAVSGAFLAKGSLSLDLDFADAGLWKGGRAHVSLLGTFGQDPSEVVGDIQVVNNIAAPEGVGFYEVWYEHSLGERVSLLAGYRDFNAEFDVTPAAAELLNSSFGIGPELSQFGPSIFPSTHPGVRVRVHPGRSVYVQAAGYRGLSFKDATGERELKGTMAAMECGWDGESVKVAIGGWQMSGTADDGQDSTRTRLSGVYVLAQKTVELSDRAVSVFARAGRTRNEWHPVHGYAGAGVRISAPVASRPDDVLSLGVARADLTPLVQRRVGADAETTIELTWLLQLREWLAIQPDLQYVDTPAGGGQGHAWIGAVRVIVGW